MISCKTEECHLAGNDITNFYHQDTLYLSLVAVCDFFDTHAIAYRRSSLTWVKVDTWKDRVENIPLIVKIEQ